MVEQSSGINRVLVITGVLFVVVILVAYFLKPSTQSLSGTDQVIKTQNGWNSAQDAEAASLEVLPIKPDSKPNPIRTAVAGITQPQDGLTNALNDMLKDNLTLHDLPAKKLADGTVIIDTRGRLKTVTVARLNEDGELVISEFNESPEKLTAQHVGHTHE